MVECETECRKLWENSEETKRCCEFRVVDGKDECTMGYGADMVYTGDAIALVNVLYGVYFK